MGCKDFHHINFFVLFQIVRKSSPMATNHTKHLFISSAHHFFNFLLTFLQILFFQYIQKESNFTSFINWIQDKKDVIYIFSGISILLVIGTATVTAHMVTNIVSSQKDAERLAALQKAETEWNQLFQGRAIKKDWAPVDLSATKLKTNKFLSFMLFASYPAFFLPQLAALSVVGTSNAVTWWLLAFLISQRPPFFLSLQHIKFHLKINDHIGPVPTYDEQ